MTKTGPDEHARRLAWAFFSWLFASMEPSEQRTHLREVRKWARGGAPLVSVFGPVMQRYVIVMDALPIRKPSRRSSRVQHAEHRRRNRRRGAGR